MTTTVSSQPTADRASRQGPRLAVRTSFKGVAGLGLAALVLATAGLVVMPAPALAADAAGTATKTSNAKPKPRASRSKQARRSHRALRDQAKGLALADQTISAITAGQLEVASRVHLGRADCEFRQSVTVTPWAGHPGHFHVAFGKHRFLMVPEETSSGAVRLEDKRTGKVWLQIPSKSMLMDAKRGQRMVDACTHAEQRQALLTTPAGGGLGIASTATR
jgi:hypothetical protein